MNPVEERVISNQCAVIGSDDPERDVAERVLTTDNTDGTDGEEQEITPPQDEFTNTEASHPATLPPIGEEGEPPEGPGIDGNKPLMRNRSGHCGPSTTGNAGGNTFYAARQIAEALRVTKKTVHRIAVKEGWPSRLNGNLLEYLVPAELDKKCLKLFPESGFVEGPKPAVKFADLTHDDGQRTKVLLRECAVLKYQELVKSGYGKELALAASITHVTREAEKVGAWGRGALERGALERGALERRSAGAFSVSPNTLRGWIKLYDAHGLDGLVEQKQGRCGRKSALSLLDEFQAAEFVKRGKALAIDFGAKGRSNVARAARELSTHPDLAGPLREHLHGGHASKSYVNPSIRRALAPAPLTIAMAQLGTRAARLSASFTPADYSDLRAGDVFVSDDMTSNKICWCEWPNHLGYRVGQPQLLPVMDVGSLRWLNFRLILRESGQYNSDDIWGLFGDVFDEFGLPRRGFLLEGGHWQANKVIGFKTGLSDEDRLGGLSSLGLKVWHTHSPGGKGMLETMLNQVQYAGDKSAGLTLGGRLHSYIGREQRKDLNEETANRLAICKGGGEHPRKWFPHIRELADEYQTTFENLNQERNDGKICRGETPLEKWGGDFTEANEGNEESGEMPSAAALESRGPLKKMPEEAKWMYRSAMTVAQVTRNGLRICQGSGAKLLTHYYDNPELLTSRQGTKVVVFWNDYNIEADAVVLSAQKPRRFLGIAKYVQPLSRFDATNEQLDAEAARKRARLHYSRSELRSIQPERRSVGALERQSVGASERGSVGASERQSVGASERGSVGASDPIGSALAAAASRAEKKQTRRVNLARELSRVEVTEEMIRASTRSEEEI